MSGEPASPADDAALVVAAAGGDTAAVQQLLQRHLPGLRAYVRLRAGATLRKHESSSDLVQSVCRDVLENMGRFRYPGEAAFRAWLYATALRKIADRAEYWRAAKRDPGREVPLDARGATPTATDDARLMEVYRASFFSPSQAAMGREALARIEQAFEKLPEDYREVIVLSRVVGLSRAEIAERMGRTEASVRNLVSRALAELAEHLEGEAAAGA
ncbi:MAG TPA: sigma-70 family RNA polymerase sigma factor [Planctomycetota bacterium]|nr:sigma-70 family RNA polymerase sigma factor [Planctomycetota bacterium]